jgi:hypothetical protein
MKKAMILFVLITAVSKISFSQTWQQTWSDMSKEEKMMKMKSYRSDNQKFLKDSLGMTSKQLKSIDSVNSDYMKELDRIHSSSASDNEKLAKAQEITKKRGADLDSIMGEDMHMKFTKYVYAKLEKAQK